MAKIRVFLVFIVLTSQCFAMNIMVMNWGVDSPVSQGFRDGLLIDYPDARFYTFGSNKDMKLFRTHLEFSKKLKPDMYFTDNIIAAKELLKDENIPPVVFVMIKYPYHTEIFSGLDMNRTTGVSTMIPVNRQLKALKKVVDFKKIGVLKSEGENYSFIFSQMMALGSSLGYKLVELECSDASNLEKAIRKHKIDAVYIPSGVADHETFSILKKHKLPTIAQDARDVRLNGALLSLVVDGYRAGRLASHSASHILSGTSIGSLDVLFIEHFMVAVNLKTASEIQVDIPVSFLIIADEISK